ncbi:MAG: HAMP domain-containing protein, partial [candidate division Zixibacteria bacterium]|nr:HAMP domain-containing protein [candidate division Zixibacteria bacterium]
MRTFRNWRLRTKMTVLVIGACCIALVCASVIFVQYESESTKDGILQELSLLARIIADNSSAAVLFDSPSDAEGILSALSAEPSIRLGEIHTSDGRLFAQYIGDTVGMSIHALMPAPKGRTFHAGHVHLWKPIVVDGDSLGVVHLLADLHEIDEHIAAIARTTGIAIFISLLLSLVFSAQIQRIIVRPIVELADLTEQVSSENDYSLRAAEHGEDEVGILVNQFNTMMTRIQLTSRALQDAHDHLERRVRERTEELEQEIAERKQREVELRDSKARLHEEKEERGRLAVAIEQSPEGIFIAEANGAIQ